MGYEKYKKTSVMTASREKILLMLYETAIKSCKLAKIAIEKKDIPAKCKHISKVHDIVVELLATLDRDKSPELVDQLSSLYTFCSAQLVRINLNNDIPALDNVTSILTTLYEGWVAAIDQLEKQAKETKK